MRLNCYPHPEDGLWISEANLASALKKGEADVHCYNTDPHHTRIEGAVKSAFHRLVWHNGLRIREAIAREMKWLGVSLLFVWLPLRHWLVPRISARSYNFIVGFMLVMVVGALAEIILCWRKGKQLPVLLENFKISTIKHFPARPRSPVSRTDIKENGPNLKYWAGFLMICLIVSSIVPWPATWIVVHPMGGQDYVTSGPALIRPFSSWYVVPKTHRATVYIPLRVIYPENGRERTPTDVVVLELRVEWTVADPLDYRPREWLVTLDRATGQYLYYLMENLKGQFAPQYPDETTQEIIAIEYIGQWLDGIAGEIEKMEHPTEMRVVKAKIKTMTIAQYSNYYQSTRKR